MGKRALELGKEIQSFKLCSSSPFAPVDLQVFLRLTVKSFPLQLVTLLLIMQPHPPSPGAGIVQLVVDCLTQLSCGLIITPATISESSPAAVRFVLTRLSRRVARAHHPSIHVQRLPLPLLSRQVARACLHSAPTSLLLRPRLSSRPGVARALRH